MTAPASSNFSGPDGGARLEDRVEARTAELRSSLERERRLSAVLRRMRDINQLITREPSRHRLLQRACEILVQAPGVRWVWFVALDAEGRAETFAEAGVGPGFTALRAQAEAGVLPDCCRRALASQTPVVVAEPTDRCASCPLASRDAATMCMALAARHAGNTYGVFVAALPKATADDSEALLLLYEALADLAFALYSIDLDRRGAQAEEALRDSEARFRGAFDSAAVGMALLAPDGRWLEVNSALCAILGYSEPELLARTVQDVTHEADLAAESAYAQQVLAGEIAAYQWEKRCLHKQGHVVWVLSDVSLVRNRAGEPQYFVAQLQDISARKRAEAERERLEGQLRAAQKMDAIGRLASGLAHDFNNALSTILGSAALVLDRLPAEDPARADLLGITKAAERATALTRQLLAFSRKQVLQPARLNLNQIVEGMDKTLRQLVGENIEFVQKLAPDLGFTMADPGQIEQVLMNLVVNARDAMPEGGTLTVETTNVEMDEALAASLVGGKPGAYVEIAITDTGCGMDEQTQARIFEPFFTTKEPGRGTGLGLSTVYGIVQQSGGSIAFASEVGRGTAFRIYLPRTTAAEATAPAGARRSSGGETILVVEDDASVLQITRRILEAAGYSVLTATDGSDALRIVEQHPGEIHLLVTDVVMPRMGGRVLAERLIALRPALKVLYMSGYSDEAITHPGVGNAGTRLLGKPFNRADLIRMVHQTLGEHGSEVTPRPAPELAADPAMATPAWDKALLQALPQEVLGKLRRAAVAARYDDLEELVEAMQVSQPAIASGLRPLVHDFAYERILALLEA